MSGNKLDCVKEEELSDIVTKLSSELNISTTSTKSNEEMTEQEKCIAKLNEELESLKKQLSDQSEEMKKMQDKMSELQEDYEAKIKDCKACIISKNYTLFNSYSVEFIWKIEQYEKLKKDAIDGTNNKIYSDPFYTDKFGYKLRLIFHPMGHGDGKETHLSLFLQVMSGPFDDILNWPIQYNAVFYLLDQSIHKGHHYEEIKSNSSTSDCFNKPLIDLNKSWGLHEFYAINKLKPLYLVDDQLFIKATVTIKS